MINQKWQIFVLFLLPSVFCVMLMPFLGVSYIRNVVYNQLSWLLTSKHQS